MLWITIWSARPSLLHWDSSRRETLLFWEGDASNYFCSIIRFSIQTGDSLPICIPRVQTGQRDVDLTLYTVTLQLADAAGHYCFGSGTLRHSAMDSTAVLPQPPLVKQDMSSSYYYHYNISTVLEMFNYGLSTAWTDLYSKILHSPVAPAGLAVDFAGLATPFFCLLYTSDAADE